MDPSRALEPTPGSSPINICSSLRVVSCWDQELQPTWKASLMPAYTVIEIWSVLFLDGSSPWMKPQGKGKAIVQSCGNTWVKQEESLQGKPLPESVYLLFSHGSREALGSTPTNLMAGQPLKSSFLSLGVSL